MRATISFQTEVERVNGVMLALAKQETDNIRSNAHVIETAKPHEVHEKINEALDGLYESVNQLEQYRDMLLSFERARFETTLPQPANQPDKFKLSENLNALRFDNFVNQMVGSEEEGTEDDEPEEG
jgi:hypothetical protein